MPANCITSMVTFSTANKENLGNIYDECFSAEAEPDFDQKI